MTYCPIINHHQSIMESFTLFRGPKRVRIREDDLTVEKVGRIFQVAPDAMYLTDDGNGAIFPLPSGEFPIGSMMTMGHFEVQGQPTPAAPPTPGPAPFSFSSPSASPTPVPFSFSGGPRTFPPRASGHFGKTFQRSINVGEVAGNRILTKKTLVVRFSEAEANVEAILLKAREALGQVEETFVLTDSQGNEIQDFDGTRTSQFWRQNSRKVFVLLEGEFEDLQQQRRAKVSRREDNTLLDRAEEVKVAAESLENVANAIKKLSEVATAHLQRPSLQPAKDAMSCLVCKEISKKRTRAATGVAGASNGTALTSSPTHAPAPTALHEIEMLKVKLEAEREKVNLKEEMIDVLKKDKIYLQGELTKKDAYYQEQLAKKDANFNDELARKDAILLDKMKNKKIRKQAEVKNSSSSFESTQDLVSSLSDSSVEAPKKKKGKQKLKTFCKSTPLEQQLHSEGPSHSRVRIRNSKGVILRYVAALEAFRRGKSMKAAFDAVGVDRNTVARTATVAELHLAAPEVFESISWNERVESLSTFIARCRSLVTPEIKDKISKMKTDGDLLPMAVHKNFTSKSHQSCLQQACCFFYFKHPYNTMFWAMFSQC
ncbi:uncharacterized protein LOC130405521 isoform X2 [Gadus chalcogrammus]|uniref:uncharacterized protein LOC130405521 isoform X2 n=1 Tax=Gadus chalcogrammus TaxID=1042646 RepID=UPI0024C489A6|nr:uncharacterized protein LOC130405521 isoform X2 [Gadus chalcogrammus]